MLQKQWNLPPPSTVAVPHQSPPPDLTIIPRAEDPEHISHMRVLIPAGQEESWDPRRNLCLLAQGQPACDPVRTWSVHPHTRNVSPGGWPIREHEQPVHSTATHIQLTSPHRGAKNRGKGGKGGICSGLPGGDNVGETWMSSSSSLGFAMWTLRLGSHSPQGIESGFESRST